MTRQGFLTISIRLRECAGQVIPRAETMVMIMTNMKMVKAAVLGVTIALTSGCSSVMSQDGSIRTKNDTVFGDTNGNVNSQHNRRYGPFEIEGSQTNGRINRGSISTGGISVDQSGRVYLPNVGQLGW